MARRSAPAAGGGGGEKEFFGGRRRRRREECFGGRVGDGDGEKEEAKSWGVRADERFHW
jgi:hypothetical protein